MFRVGIVGSLEYVRKHCAITGFGCAFCLRCKNRIFCLTVLCWPAGRIHFYKDSPPVLDDLFSPQLARPRRHLAAWLVFSYHSPMGYGIAGSFLFWEYWLLALASVVSALFAFHGNERYLVLLLLIGGIVVSTQLVGLLWIVPVTAIGRVLRLR